MPTSADRTARPTLMKTAIRIFELSLGEMLWSRRSIFLALLAAAPVAQVVRE